MILLGFYGKRPSVPPGGNRSKSERKDGSTVDRKLLVASPRSLRKTTSTYSREDLFGTAHKTNGTGGDITATGGMRSGGDSFTFDLPSPTTPSTSLGESGFKYNNGHPASYSITLCFHHG